MRHSGYDKGRLMRPRVGGWSCRSFKSLFEGRAQVGTEEDWGVLCRSGHQLEWMGAGKTGISRE